MRNIDSAPTVRATYLLEKWLEERIIATYFTLPQQPIYHSYFCGNLLASPALDVHPYYLCKKSYCQVMSLINFPLFKAVSVLYGRPQPPC